MAISTKNIGTIIIVVLALVLLFALNPSKDDFIAWNSAQPRNQATSGENSGTKKELKPWAGVFAGVMKGFVSRGFSRTDYLVFSTYSLGPDRYLGIAKLFIKLR